MSLLSRIVTVFSVWLAQGGYVRRWLVLGTMIGVIAGVGAIGFQELLHLISSLTLGKLAGYAPPTPIGEGNSIGSSAFPVPWAIPFVVGLGGLVSGVLVYFLAPEAEGHGTDAAIYAIHHRPRGIRARVGLVKMVASAITIGSGGSGGREGPTAQISASFASLLSRRLHLSLEDARIAVTAGMSAGIGAIFRAPLAGAIFGAEVLYRNDVATEALFPSFIASVVSFAIFGSVEGFSPIFGVLSDYRFRDPIELIYYGALGVAAGFVGRLYAKTFYGAVRFFRDLPGPRILRPAAGGFLVGLLALLIPHTLGTGYGWVQMAMDSRLLQIPLWVVLLLPFAKIVTTSLSIGSGGSGGIFGPGMAIGGFLGAGVWRLLADLRGVPTTPAPFVIVGMVACFGSVAHAPIAVTLMVSEMTGSLELLAPAMLAVGMATFVVKNVSIYESQLLDRFHSPAYRFHFGLPLLAMFPVVRAMQAPRLRLTQKMTVQEAGDRIQQQRLPGAPVCDVHGRVIGYVKAESLHNAGPNDPIGTLVNIAPRTITLGATLDEAVEVISSEGIPEALVVNSHQELVGLVDMENIVRAYRDSLKENLRRLDKVSATTVLVEKVISADSPIAGRTLREIAVPDVLVILAVYQSGRMRFPEPDIRLHPGDRLTILVPVGLENQVHAWLSPKSM